MILTHAHIDHSGYLPRLVRQGFDGPVYCTPPTRSLLRVLLPDAAHLQEEEARYANRKGYSKHKPALPLFRLADARAALKLLEPVPFDQWVRAASGCALSLPPRRPHPRRRFGRAVDQGRWGRAQDGVFLRRRRPLRRTDPAPARVIPGLARAADRKHLRRSAAPGRRPARAARSGHPESGSTEVASF